MSKPVAKDLDEAEALREVIDALGADNGRLLRLLIAGFVSDALGASSVETLIPAADCVV